MASCRQELRKAAKTVWQADEKGDYDISISVLSSAW